MRTNHLSTNPHRSYLNCNRRLVLKRVACFLSALYLVVPDVKGDAIQPWGGATAEVSSWHEGPISEQGLNSSVGKSDSRSVSYMGFHSGPYKSSWSMNNSANVYDSKSKMIGVQDYTNTSIGGTMNSGLQYEWVQNKPYAKATWTNDSIHIQPLNGQALPDHIKVQFEVNMDLSADGFMIDTRRGLYGTIELGINEKTQEFGYWDFLKSDSNPTVVQFFDGGVKSNGRGMTTENVTGVVSLDLAVNSNGWTDPFSLSLKSVPGESFYSNTPNSLTKGITIGIKDVTTLDGKSLESEGFSISYASDQPLPTPVPEPSSWVVAFTLMTIGIGYRRYSSQ